MRLNTDAVTPSMEASILMKVKKKPHSALYPCPVVLVTCVDSTGRPNVITLAWVGTLCSDPPMIGVGIRPKRFSYNLIDCTKEFVVNIPTERILEETDLCGNLSGKDVDKFTEAGFTLEPADKIKPPLIKECPVNIECCVQEKLPLGVHHLFIGEVLQVHVDQDILNADGKIDFVQAAPFVFNQGEYWSLKRKMGVYGFSKK